MAGVDSPRLAFLVPKTYHSKMKTLGSITFAILVGLLRAYALYQLWSWFVVPLGAPKIGMAHAYGLSLVGALSSSGIIYKKQTEEEELGQKALMVAIPLFSLGLGYIAHLFMA